MVRRGYHTDSEEVNDVKGVTNPLKPPNHQLLARLGL